MHNGAVHNASCAVQQPMGSQHPNYINAPSALTKLQGLQKDKIMSVFQKSLELGKDLFAINRKTTREIVAIQVGGVRRYIETNVNAVKNVPSIKSFPALAEAQRNYSSTLIAGVQSDLLAGREVVKEAVAETRAVIGAVRAEKPAARKTTRKTTRKTATRKKKPVARKTRTTAAKKAA